MTKDGFVYLGLTLAKAIRIANTIHFLLFYGRCLLKTLLLKACDFFRDNCLSDSIFTFSDNFLLQIKIAAWHPHARDLPSYPAYIFGFCFSKQFQPFSPGIIVFEQHATPRVVVHGSKVAGTLGNLRPFWNNRSNCALQLGYNPSLNTFNIAGQWGVEIYCCKWQFGSLKYLYLFVSNVV